VATTQALACTVNHGLFHTDNVDLPNPTNPVWTRISDVLAGVLQCGFDFLEPADLQCCHTGQNVYLRRPAVTGANWQSVLTAAQAKVVIGDADNGSFSWVEYSPLSGRIWVGWNYSITLGGIWILRSDDFGATWAAANLYTGLYNYQLGSILSGRAGAGDKLYITTLTGMGSNNRIFHSEDGGLTFAYQLTAMGNGGALVIAIPDPNDDDIVYASSFGGATYNLFRSIDGGINYAEIDGVLQAGCAFAVQGSGWVSPYNSNITRFTRSNNFYWSNDYWATGNARAGLAFQPSAMDGDAGANILIGRFNSAPVGGHVVFSTIDEAATFINKAGANAGVPGGGGDSIGYDCGGISKFGIALYTEISFQDALGGMVNMSGRVIKKTENTVYLRAADGFDPFEWGGKCMRIDDITKPRTGLNPAYCQDPRTGEVTLDGQLKTLAGLPTSTLVMKETQFDTVADSLENCFWDIDRRTHCKDLDYWNGWEKIRRICAGKLTERTDMGSDYDTDESENLITMPVIGSGDVITIRRVATSVQQSPESIAASWVAASVCHGEKCGSRCDSEKQCVIAMVSTLVAAGSPHLLMNNAGGASGYWTDIELTEWTVDGANDVVCLGDFILIVSDGETNPFLRSYDQGVTRVALAGNADMATNPPQCLDALDQSFVIAGAENGYIYGSTDAGSTWLTLDAGVATTLDISKIVICKTNPAVIYAIPDGNFIIKSENGGETWFSIDGPVPGDNITAIWVYDENHLLIGTDMGEVWESNDGAENWTMQEALPEVTAAADGTTIIQDFASCGCGVVWLIWKDTSVTSYQADTEQYLFRNVDNGASGRWFVPENGHLVISPAQGGSIPESVVCCGPNRALVVGGEITGTASGFVALAA